MLVRDKMSKNPITTRPSASVPDALKVMQGSKIRQLPVINDDHEMVGIVSLVDLFRVSPSPATSLSVWEVDYLLEKITVEKVMTREVITVTEDTAVEEAGRIMADNSVSGLPVMRGGELVGIITETHLFGILLELFGARRPGVRVMAKVEMEKGGLCQALRRGCGYRRTVCRLRPARRFPDGHFQGSGCRPRPAAGGHQAHGCRGPGRPR